MTIEDLKPEWLKIAEKELGQLEIAGDKDNPRIVQYHDTTDLHASDDETPWCSSFVNFCIIKAGLKGTYKANARSWLGWGNGVNVPPVGAVVVLYRGNPAGPSGHVGFFYGHAPDGKIKVLGGNQRNSVCVTEFDASKVIGYRWP